MINDETNNYHYFAVKNLLELNFLVWLRGKKEALISNDNSFQSALDDALSYSQNPERVSKLKPYINRYNWEGIDFPAGPREWEKYEQNNKAISLNILFIPRNTEKIRFAYRSEYNHKC